MRFTQLKKLALAAMVVAIFYSWAKAEEHGGGGEAAEAPKEGEAAGGGKSPGAEAKSGGEQADREWAKRTSRINVLEAKIKEATKQMQSLIVSKNAGGVSLDEKGKPIDALQKMSDTQKELKKTIEDYNKEKDELKYRYPEEGALIERRYVPLRAQSVEQIEKEMGLTGELTRTKMKIDKKYEVFVGPKPKAIPQKEGGAESTIKEIGHPAEGAESKRIRLSQ